LIQILRLAGASRGLRVRISPGFALLLAACVSEGLLGQSPGSLTGGAIYKQSAPSVVKIEAYNENNQPEWSGSGFIVSADGKLLTNFHVIRSSKRATIRLANGDAYDGVEVLDVDQRKDIALLKIKAVDLQSLVIGSSGTAQIGDTVYSLSNPMGLENTLSNGIISGIRPLDGYRLLQVTAPISHGSSGGPLFNSRGEVIGITADIIEGGQNLNFAIPIDYAKGMLASPGSPKSLASVYDPEKPSTVESPKQPASGQSNGDKAVDENLKTSAMEPYRQAVQKSVLGFLSSKLYSLEESEARSLFGEPLSHRPFYDSRGTVVGDIYDWLDATHQNVSVS
jgi:Trypsin-like peptidase domain